MKELLQVYKQTRAIPVNALYLVVWLRLGCEAGALSEDQVEAALAGNADGLALLLATVKPGVRASEARGVLRAIEREIAG